MKKTLLFLLTLTICLFCFYVPAYADITYVNPDDYGFDKSVIENYNKLPKFKEDKPYIVTFDDNDNYYKIVNDIWGDEPTVSYGVYNNNDYCLIKSNSGYTYSYAYDFSTSEWKSVKGYNNGYIILGNYYIQEHSNDIALKLGVNPDEFYYSGSNILMNNNWDVVFTPVKNFFPRRPVTVLTKVIQTTTVQGVLKELIGLLPALIPCIIVYLALRKGLKFTLKMLKAS